MIISGKEMKTNQAEGTGTEPVPEEAMVREAVQVVGTAILFQMLVDQAIHLI